jgi:hypothetical protein
MRSGKVARALSSKIRSASLLADMPLWHCDIGSHVRAKAAYDRPASAVGHCDICATANAVSDAVRGLASRLPLGPPKILANHGQ